MIEWSKTVVAALDAELGIPRNGPVTYHCTAAEGQAAGLVFLVHGFGPDAAPEYDRVLRRFIAGHSGCLAVSVEYHAYHSRPETGAIRDIPPDTQERIFALWKAFAIDIPLNGENLAAILNALDAKLYEKVTLRALLRPPNGDYQNFGLLAALDHLAVLNDIIDSGFEFDRNRIIAVGSSHGGYIAHFLAKLAPNTVAGVIDNSSYVLAHPKFLGNGIAEYQEELQKISIQFSVFTEWVHHNPYSPRYFGPSAMLIRDLSNLGHLRSLASAAARKCQYRMFNATDDTISEIGRKRRQLASLKRAGFDATLQEDFGGKPISGHANVSLPQLFKEALPQISHAPTRLDRFLGTEIAFDCFDRIYTVRHSDTAPYSTLEITANPDY